MFLIQSNQSFSTALQALLKNVKLDAVEERRGQTKHPGEKRIRASSQNRFRNSIEKVPGREAKRGSSPILALERYWLTR